MNEIITLEQLNSLIKKALEAIEENTGRIAGLEKKVNKTDREVYDMQTESPLDPAQCDDISAAVRSVGCKALGGKKSNAYKNSFIRTKVYRDIYYIVKREYGLVLEDGRQLSYKRLKKKYFKPALDTIHSYSLPLELENEITAENELELDD